MGDSHAGDAVCSLSFSGTILSYCVRRPLYAAPPGEGLPIDPSRSESPRSFKLCIPVCDRPGPQQTEKSGEGCP